MVGAHVDQGDVSSDQVGTRWRRFFRSYVPAALVLIVGASASLIAASAFRNAERRHAATVLTRRAEDVRFAVNAELRRYIDMLQDLSVASAVQSQLAEWDFTTITSQVRHDRLPGIGALLFITPDGTVRYGRSVEAAGETARPSIPDPNDPDSQAASQGDARQAMTAARERGQVTASRPWNQVDAGRGRTRQMMALAGPVYAGPATPDAGSFRGWVLATVRVGEVLDQAVLETSDGSVAISVSDITERGDPIGITDSGEGSGHLEGGATRQVDLVTANRTWRLTATATGPLVTGPGTYTDETTLVGGLLITVLLAGVAWLLATSRERALVNVEQATAALRADIARREAVEAQLRDREAEIAGFIAVTAHDLRTPMTNVSAYADLLSEIASENLDATCQGFLQRIGSGTRRMTRLIDDLLDFATANNAPLRPETVDLNSLCAEVVSEHTVHLGDARPNVDIGSLPTVEGDPATLIRLLDNLIGNAIKYVRHGDTAQIAIGSRKEPDGWRIEVADRGIGIPQEQRDAVFAAFHRDRAAEGYPGTGLGLAICKRIVERHGGHIGIEANPGGGSRFWFTLPETLPADFTSSTMDLDSAPLAATPEAAAKPRDSHITM